MSALLAKVLAWSPIARHIKSLESKRVVWNWLFLWLFFAVSIYLTLTHPVECGNTIVVTLGGMVTAIMTNYVWADYAQRKSGVLSVETPVPEGKIDPGTRPDGE